MSSTYSGIITLTIFGQSHSEAVGMVLEGIPAGCEIDFERINAFMKRRAPGRNEFSTPRREADEPEFLSGFKGNLTCGTPICAVIRNKDTRSGDYGNIRTVPRPGHADLTAFIKYGEAHDHAGGGHFSGRLTAPLCIAGAICIQLLEKEGIDVMARIASVGGISDRGELTDNLGQKEFPVVDDLQGEKMRECIAQARSDGDSVGGTIECMVTGLPAGLGDPIFDGMENRIARIVFGIPAVKGIEFGAGFAAAEMRGSENNDSFLLENGRIVTETNHSGGILGGITNGMPLVFRAAVKPTPSIAKAQKSVDLTTMQETELRIKGRHDPCIVPRAVPCMEAAAAVAVYDALLESRTSCFSRYTFMPVQSAPPCSNPYHHKKYI